MLLRVKSESPRVLSFLDWTSVSDRFEDLRFDSIQSFMLLSMLSHCGVLLRDESEMGWLARFVLAPAFLLSACIGLRFRKAKAACLLANWAVTSLWLVFAWPRFANHLFLEWSVLLFLCLCRKDKVLGMNALRWLVIVVFFHSGFQKLVMGQYFEGQFLLARVAISTKFKTFFELLLSDTEIARVVGMGARLGTGPYTSSDTLFLVVSNSIWLGEITVALLLFFPRMRRPAIFGGIALIAGIELGAREIVFGALFTMLLLTFYQGKNANAWWPYFAMAQLCSVASRLLFPEWRFN